MNKKIVLTGITGQIGSYLSESILDRGDIVYGIIRRSSVDTKSRIRHLLNFPNLFLNECDITDASGITKIIAEISPDIIINMAAQSHVHTSFSEPRTSMDITCCGVINILEAIRQINTKIKFIQASSSEMFGDTVICPQNEKTVFSPSSPYAIAKVAAHHFVQLYRKAYGLFASTAICFNNESPRRGENFVTRKITKYVANVYHWKLNKIDTFPCLELGNLDARRDWSHTKDVARGILKILEHDCADDFVLATGETRTIREFLDSAFKIIGINNWDTYVVQNPKFMRPAEVPLLLGDSTKAKTILGWKPEISFDNLVAEMVHNDIITGG